MSIRAQFFLSVILALAFCLTLGAASCWQAGRVVQLEMHKSLISGDQIIAVWLKEVPQARAGASNANIDIYLSRMVSTFNGNRRLWAEYVENGKVRTFSRPASWEPTPAWFPRLLAIPLEHRIIAVPGDTKRQIRLHTETNHEIASVWGQYRGFSASLALFSLLVLGMLVLVMRRIEAPLKRLRAGFDAVGGGDYAARVAPDAPSELSPLAHAFNRMAERLDRAENANRRMSRQLLAIQEEERAELARELHDEMGPFLFAMRVDAEAIEASARKAGSGTIMARARAVSDAVTHIQRHVRLILKQLRPTDFADFGLRASIENLADFWRRHVEDVQVELDLAQVRDGFGAEADAAIYRLVQEGLTNAVRHGRARHVWIAVTADAETVGVSVEDDGVGLGGNPQREDGLGLKGMRERLAGLGSELILAARPGGGTRLAAAIARQRARRLEPVS